MQLPNKGPTVGSNAPSSVQLQTHTLQQAFQLIDLLTAMHSRQFPFPPSAEHLDTQKPSPGSRLRLRRHLRPPRQEATAGLRSAQTESEQVGAPAAVEDATVQYGHGHGRRRCATGVGVHAAGGA